MLICADIALLFLVIILAKGTGERESPIAPVTSLQLKSLPVDGVD